MKDKFLLLKILTAFLILMFLSGCTPKDTTPPSVSITFPLNNATVSGPIDIIASATDDVGISKVEFYIDGSKVGEATQTPYKYTWDTDSLQYGFTHTIQAKAYDLAGNKAESPVITVTIGDTQEPQVTITNPLYGDIASATVFIQAQVVDKMPSVKNKKIEKATSGISKVEFYIDDNKIGEATEVPYECSWDTTQVSNGTHTITVKAIDNAGNSGSTSIAVNVINLGTITWQKTFGGSAWDEARSVQQTKDGGYIVAGSTCSFEDIDGDVYILKLNADGSLAWQKSWGGVNEDHAYSIQETNDGGYILAGATWSFGAGKYDAYVLKIDASGDFVWHKYFGGAYDDWAYSVQQTNDGGYIVAGGTSSNENDPSNVYILKLNADGSLDWQETFGGTAWDEAYSIQQTTDGGYIVAGSTSSFGSGYYDLYILKLKSDGSLDWQKTFGGSNNDEAYSIQQTDDGGYIVAGYTEPSGAGHRDVYILKLNANGDKVWEKILGGSDDNVAWSVQQTDDGGYIVSGSIYSSDITSFDVYVLKLDASGNLIWRRIFGGIYWENGYSVQQTLDGGYIVAGSTSSFGAGLPDAYVLKLDENGNTGPYPTISLSPANNFQLKDKFSPFSFKKR